jgi:hypothetical protein
VNHLARRGQLVPGSEFFGRAFESWVHHEFQAYRAYHDFGFELAFWRIASGSEVDFRRRRRACRDRGEALMPAASGVGGPGPDKRGFMLPRPVPVSRAGWIVS